MTVTDIILCQNGYIYVLCDCLCENHMQLHAYLIKNRAPHVINSHVHQAVTILSGKKNIVMRHSYVLLVVQHDFNICMNRQLLEEAGVQFLWHVNVHG